MKVRLLRKVPLYFTNLFFKISILTLTVIILLSFFLYFNFSRFGIEIINKSNEKLLSKIGNNAVQINNYVKEFSYTLFSNENAVKLMLGNPISLFDAQSCLKKLDNTLSAAPFIYSAYFYNSKENSYFTIGPDVLIRKKQDFFDKEINNVLENITEYNILQPLARRIPSTIYNPETTVDVYTYVIPELQFRNSTVRNALIVNIKADWLFNSINYSLEDDLAYGNNVLILDENRKVIGATQNKLYLSNLSKKPFVENVFNTSKTSGYFTDNLDGEKSVITYVKIESTKWCLLSITPYQNILRPINEVKNISLIICIIILGFSLLSTFYLSKTLYSPIGNLRNEIDKLLGTHISKNERDNEFEVISKNFSSVFDRLSTLQSFMNSNLNLLKQEFLRDLLLNRPDTQKKMEMKSQELCLQINEDDTFVVLVMKIDHYQDTFSQLNESDQSLYRFALSNIAAELIFQKYKCETVNMSSDHIAVIIDLEQDNNPILHINENIPSLVREVQQSFNNYYQLSLTVGIGHPYIGFKNLHAAYKNTLDASNYRICYGHGSILISHELEISQTEEFALTNNNINSLLDAIKKSKLEDIEKHLSFILSALQKCRYNNIMYSISYLTSSIFSTLSYIEKNITASFELDYMNFSNQINQLETLEEIHQAYLKLFQNVIQKVIGVKDNKSAVIADNIIKYIKANYTDPNLSINTIAAFFHLSAPYVGKLFRDYTFQSLSDYINDYRLSKARELLVNTDYTIDEIIDKIKWENKNYFFTLFKKQFGVTPTQYRLKVSVSEIQNDSGS